MQTTLSTKGQVVIPTRIRRALDLHPGDALEAGLDGRRIILTPRKAERQGARLVRDPLTGLPVLTLGTKGSTLTSKYVREILEEFP